MIRSVFPVVCAVIFATATGACSARQQITSPNDALPTTRRIVVLGDSLAVSPTRDDSFPAILQARVTALGLNWTVTNAGIRGDTTAGGLRRVDALLGPDVGVLVLALGANDGLRADTIWPFLEPLLGVGRTTAAR